MAIGATIGGGDGVVALGARPSTVTGAPAAILLAVLAPVAAMIQSMGMPAL